MLVRITTIEPSKSKPKKKIKCKDCSLTYSFEDYLSLSLVKKLSYLRIHDEEDIYCHECCIKRMAFLTVELEDVVFVIINGEDQKLIDLK